MENKYVSDPYFSSEVKLQEGYSLKLHWNIFEDKKDDNKLVMRVRYVLNDINGVRISLKVLDLTKQIEYEQIYLTDLEFLENNKPFVFIQKYFGNWLSTDFVDMIDSGKFKIICINDFLYL